MTIADFLFHLSPVALMGLMLSLNRRLTKLRSRQRTDAEASRLAIAISIELQCILQMYSDNLALLQRDGSPLMLGRLSGQAYRSNTGRMVTLFDDRVISALVLAYTRHERTEALAGACCSTVKQNLTKPDAPSPERLRLRDAYRSGCESIEAAASALALAWPIAGTLEGSYLYSSAEMGELSLANLSQVG